MAFGTVLVWLAGIMASGSILTSLLSLRYPEEQYRRISKKFNLFTFFCTSFAILSLGVSFLVDDFSLQTVYDHSSTSLPLHYKLAALWAGRGGSYLLWAWIVSIVLIAEEALFNQYRIKVEKKAEGEKGKGGGKGREGKGDGKGREGKGGGKGREGKGTGSGIQLKRERKHLKRRRTPGDGSLAAMLQSDHETFFCWMRIAGLLVLISLLLVVNHYDVFEETSYNVIVGYDEHGEPLVEKETDPDEGRGLDPSLETPLMVIHPPVTFLAYGMAVLPFSAAVAFFLTGYRGWYYHSLRWARPTWFFFTLGLGLGALWAYTELSFGGYWAWDPVEVGNLLPWFAVTALLHMHLRPRKEYTYFAPLVCLLMLLMTFFATFSTRAGGLWLSSAHDYAASGEITGDADHRLEEVIAGNFDVAVIFASMVVIYLMSCGLVTLRYFMDNYHEDFRNGKRDSRTVFPLFYLLFLAALSVYAILDISGLVSISLALAGIVPGHAGVMVVLVMVILPLLLWLYATLDEEEEEIDLSMERIIDDKSLMQITVATLVFALIITLTTMVTGINGMGSDDYNEKMIFIVPFLFITLILCLIWKMAGREWGLRFAALSMLGIIASMLFMSRLLAAMLLPGAVVALGALFLKLSETVSGMRFRFSSESEKEDDKGKGTSGRSRGKRMRALMGKNRDFGAENLAAVMVFFSGMLGLIMWCASPIRAILIINVETSDVMIISGFILSLVAMILSPAVAARENFGLAVIAGLAAVASSGFLVGSVLGVIALFLIMSNRVTYRDSGHLKLTYANYENWKKDDFVLFSRAFLQKVHRDIMMTWPSLKKLGSHMIHLGVVLLVIGYAVSTSYEVRSNTISAQEGSSRGIALEDFNLHITNVSMNHTISDRATRFVHPDGIARITRLHELHVSMTVDIVSRDSASGDNDEGDIIAEGVKMNYFESWYNVTNKSGEQVRKVQKIAGGAYSANLGFRDIFIIYRADFSEETLEPNGRVELELRYIPMMNIVWSGMWLMVAGGLVVLLAITEKRREKDVERDEKKDKENKKVEKKDMENGKVEKKDKENKKVEKKDMENGKVEKMDKENKKEIKEK